MKSHSSPSSAVLALCLILAGRLGQAEEPHKVHNDRAVAYYKEGKYAEAIKEYGITYELKSDPNVLFNIGLCYLRLKQPREALEQFASYRREVPNPAPKTEERLHRYEKEAQDMLAPPPPVSRLHVVPPPPLPPPLRTGRGPRAKWRTIAGALAMGVGVGLVVWGAIGLSINGMCVSNPDADPSACRFVYDSVANGAALTSVGAATAVAGAVMVAWPGERRQEVAEIHGAGVRLALSF